MNKLTLTVAAVILATGSSLGFGAGRLVINVKPPRARVEVRTARPGPNHVWVSGHWAWKGSAYVWLSGSWVVRPHPKSVWVSGHWTRRHGTWVRVPGHWK